MGAGENLVIKAPCEGRANPRGRSPDSCPRCQRALVGTSHVALGRAALSLVLCKSRSWVTLHPHACAPGVSPLSTWLPTLALALPAPGPLHVLSPPPESLPLRHGPCSLLTPLFPAAFTYFSGRTRHCPGLWACLPSLSPAAQVVCPMVCRPLGAHVRPAHRALSTWEWMRAVPQDISHRTAACAC